MLFNFASPIPSFDADLISFGFVVRDTPKEQPWVKIRKKVSFNLNVQTYEPIPDDHYFLESDEEVKTEEHCQEAKARTTDSTSLSDKAFTTSNSGNYPQNHRYQNCEDSYDMDDDDDEEDDFGYGESDLNDSEIDEDRDEFRLCEMETNTANRRQQVHSVLKPVENLTQWRTAKAKEGIITKHQTENKIKSSEQPKSPVFFSSNSSLTDTQMQENLVHSSLSDWLSELHKG